MALLSRAARNSPDGVPTRQALASQSRGGWLSHLPLFRALSPGLPRPRPGRAAGAALGVVPARTLLGKRKHVRHRPAPLSRPTRLRRLKEQNPGPVAGFARRPKAPPASGTTLATASPLAAPYVGTPPPGHSLPPASKRSRSIRQRERTESGTGMGGVDKSGAVSHQMTGNAGIGMWSRPRIRDALTHSAEADVGMAMKAGPLVRRLLRHVPQAEKAGTASAGGRRGRD